MLGQGGRRIFSLGTISVRIMTSTAKMVGMIEEKRKCKGHVAECCICCIFIVPSIMPCGLHIIRIMGILSISGPASDVVISAFSMPLKQTWLMQVLVCTKEEKYCATLVKPTMLDYSLGDDF